MASPAVAAIAEPVSPKSLADKAYDRLIELITRLELAPGSVLAEKVLMAQLGIGRTPIREALQRLALEGLVHHQPNRGMFVSEISAASVQHIYEFRSLIDGHAARLAALRAAADNVAELTMMRENLVAAIERDDIDGFVASDRGFYESLARAAENTYLGEVIPRIFNLHLRLWFYISKKTGTWHDIARAHAGMVEAVVDAIARKDPEDAESAVKAYVADRHRDIRDLL